MKFSIFSFLGCLCFLVFINLSIFGLVYAYDIYSPGSTATIGEFVYDDNFMATTTAGCTLMIYDPSENLVYNGAMTASSSGWTYYNYSIPAIGPAGTWLSEMTCGSVANGDLVKVDKSFIVGTTSSNVYDAILTASSSVTSQINSNTNTQASNIISSINTEIGLASSSLDSALQTASSSIVSQILSTIAGIPASVWTYISDTSRLAANVWSATTRTLTGAGLDSGSLATVAYIDTATSTLTAEIQSGYTVTLSDFGETTVNTAYKAKLQVLNYATVPTDADSLPTLTITDPVGTVQVPAGVMTKDSDGTYSYSYSIGGSAVGGVWETVVSTVINGETVRTNDYWTLSSSPADVNIVEITDKVIPTITANVRIDNMGSSASDFYYIYCIVNSESNLCGGGDDIDYASDTAYINAGDFINLSLTLDEVPTAGTYWFKVKARALAETNWAGSSEQFTAESGTVTPPGGGGGGGGAAAVVPTIPAGSCNGADFNTDNKVNSVDFSILLAFWKTNPPFKNPCVDINKDNKVNSVDFSILLYQWKK